MHKFLKRQTAFYIAAMLCVGVCFAWYVLQSNWLQERIRQRTIAAVQRATGGRVELKAFRFRLHSFTAEMGEFVLHGTESGQEAPLFRADSVQVQLQIASLLRRDVLITSLQVEAPQFHILLRADGRTNIPNFQPTASYQLTNELLRLKVQKARLIHGLFQVNNQRIPMDLAANDFTLILLYDRAGSSYTLHLAAPMLDVRWRGAQELAGSLQADAQLAQNQLTLTKAILRSGDSQAELSGNLRHFAQPIIHWNVQSKLAASQLGTALRLRDLKSGTVNIKGSGDWDFHAPLSFTGEISGQHLPKNIRLQSKLIIKENVTRLADLDVAGPGFQWKGKAELTDDRKIALRCELARLDLRTVAVAAGAKGLPWSALARGPIDADGLLGPQPEDFIVRGNLQISPTDSSPPVSGNVHFTYRQRGNSIELANSKLYLPGTEISVAGTPGTNFKLLVDSTDLRELQPLLPLAHKSVTDVPWPVLLRDGTAHFDGSMSGSLNDPQVAGVLALTNFQMNGASWRSLRSSFQLQKSLLTLSSLLLQQDFVRGRASGQVALANWRIRPENALHLEGDFSGLDITHFTGRAGGLAAGSFNFSGTLADPAGKLQVKVANPSFHGEHLDSLQATVRVGNSQLQLLDGKGKSGNASFHFSGDYRHEPGHWERGISFLTLQSSVFAISDLLFVRQSAPELSAQTKIDGKISFYVNPDGLQLKSADGSIALHNIAINRNEYGGLNVQVSTQGQLAEGHLEGNFRASRLWGTAQVQLTSEMPAQAQLQFGQTDLQALTAVLPSYIRNAALKGSVRGSVSLQGPLQQREKIRAAVQLDDLQIASPEIKGANLFLRNSAPVFLEVVNGAVTVRSMELTGQDTKLSISGHVPFAGNRPMQLKVNGDVDLRIAELFSSNLQSSGESMIAAVLGGTPLDPTITGTAEFHNGSVAVNGLPNGLSDLNGTIEFSQNRATLRKVTAHSGGGDVALGGFVTFSASHPLVYRLEAAGQNVRIRYANGISVTGASQLALTGSSQASVLSGTATISRIIFNPNADVGALLASTIQTESISAMPGFLSGLQFDVQVDSAPDMQLSTSLSRDVQATVDLQLRGNPKNPVLLGSVEANEGDVRAFGGRYTINRGQISFTNPARIEPALDLDLRTQARGVNIDITIAGTLSRMNINYRSDPPLQPRDIIALLTVGRAPSIDPNAPTSRLNSNDITAQLGANTLLGQAVSPNSSRLQRLFGITNIRIDPLVQGITNTSQGRLTLEQQISRQITVTYVTNLSQTAEQIFRLEYALNPQFSLVALRDDNGEFGIDILYKKRFK